MTDQFVNAAKDNMSAVEKLLKGLPGISGYVDKELRRDADKRLRDVIAGQLEEQKQALFSIQKKLLKGGGLMLLDDVDGAVQKLQILIDRVKTASYGYAGFFDAVRIKEEQLDALHRFDVALLARVVDVQNAVEKLDNAVSANENIGQAVEQLTDLVADLNTLYNRRYEAIISPDLLTDTSYAPEVDPDLLSIGS